MNRRKIQTQFCNTCNHEMKRFMKTRTYECTNKHCKIAGTLFFVEEFIEKYVDGEVVYKDIRE